MTDFPSHHPRMTHGALRIFASSGARVPKARFTPCVLNLLDPARPRAQRDGKAVI